MILQVLIKHPDHASLPLITCCGVNWIIVNLIKLQFGSQSLNKVKLCSLSISSRDQMRKGWCLKPEFWVVSSIMHWNGKVWSGLSIWSLNPLVPLYRVGLLFFCLSILYCRFQCNPLSNAVFQHGFFFFPLDCSPHHCQYVIQYLLLTSWKLHSRWADCVAMALK